MCGCCRGRTTKDPASSFTDRSRPGTSLSTCVISRLSRGRSSAPLIFSHRGRGTVISVWRRTPWTAVSSQTTNFSECVVYGFSSSAGPDSIRSHPSQSPQSLPAQRFAKAPSKKEKLSLFRECGLIMEMNEKKGCEDEDVTRVLAERMRSVVLIGLWASRRRSGLGFEAEVYGFSYAVRAFESFWKALLEISDSEEEIEVQPPRETVGAAASAAAPPRPSAATDVEEIDDHFTPDERKPDRDYNPGGKTGGQTALSGTEDVSSSAAASSMPPKKKRKVAPDGGFAGMTERRDIALMVHPGVASEMMDWSSEWPLAGLPQPIGQGCLVVGSAAQAKREGCDAECDTSALVDDAILRKEKANADRLRFA